MFNNNSFYQDNDNYCFIGDFYGDIKGTAWTLVSEFSRSITLVQLERHQHECCPRDTSFIEVFK